MPCRFLPQVQKSAEHYTEAAHDEIDLLAAIAGHAELCPEGAAACVRLRDNFEHRGPHGRHVCMVFEVGTVTCAVPMKMECAGILSLGLAPWDCVAS